MADQHPSWLLEKCPYCQAPPGSPCVITRGPRKGKRARAVHAARVQRNRARVSELQFIRDEYLDTGLSVVYGGAKRKDLTNIDRWLQALDDDTNEGAAAVLADIIMEGPCYMTIEAITGLGARGAQRFRWMRHNLLHSARAHICTRLRALVIPDGQRIDGRSVEYVQAV